MKSFILLGVLLFFSNIAYSQTVSNQTDNSSQSLRAISEEEIVKIAENFIIENGYTDLPPTDDKKKIVFESIEWTENVEEILKSRHNTLQKKAYGILKGRKGGTDGFTVVFLYVDKSVIKTGRAVTMDSDGTNIRVEHVNIFLKAVERKL